MVSNAMSKIQDKWEQLKLALKDKPSDDSSQSELIDVPSTLDLKVFLDECVDTGQYITSQVERDKLQWIAREVSDRIFWVAKEYPSATIKPPLTSLAEEKSSDNKKPLDNLPHKRNPFFTGRGDVLKTLHNRLFKQDIAGKSSIEVITGLGGIGKTQAAVEYAYRFCTQYEYIFFINADSEEEISHSLEEISQCLQLLVPESRTWEEITNIVRIWLTSHKNWLLIIDNAENIEPIASLLPSSFLGHVILTSRKTVFDTLGIANPIKLSVLEPDESISFLFKRTKREDTDESEHQAADQLAGELGHLPLALEQAGAYIDKQESRFQNYLKSYRKRGLGLLRISLPVIGHRRSSILDTWNINFKAVEQASNASADLLYLSAFLSSKAIPIELLIEGYNELGPNLTEALVDVDKDPLILDDLLKPLTDYSLIRRDPNTNTYNIHHLVQEVLRDRLDSKTHSVWAERVVKALGQVFPKIVEYENWVLCDRLLPHAKIAADLVKEYQLEFESAASLINRTGRYLSKRAQYNEAELLIGQALDLRESLPQHENPDIATSLTDLARVYRGQGHNNKAEPLYKKALELRKQQLGEDHPKVATSLYNLARLYYYQARYKKAETAHIQALELRRKIQRENNKNDTLDVADSLNSLARLYEAQGRYGRAEPLYQEALSLRTKILGKKHPDVATSLYHLASLYESQGRYREAEPTYQEALDLRQNILGENHTDVATSLNNLANLYASMAQYNKAESLYQRALILRKQLLGDEHPAIAQNMSDLARLYEVQGLFRKAENQYQQALEIYKELDRKHPDLAKSLNDFADLYRVKGLYEKAEELYKEALKLRKRLLGEEHPDMIESLDDLARLYRYQGRFKKAEKIYTKVLKLSQRLLGNEHPDTARVLNSLARLYFSQGRYDEAEPLFVEALETRKQIFGEEHPDVATSLNNLALLWAHFNHFDEAESLHQQALKLREHLLGKNHPDVATSLSNLALLYSNQKRYDEAEPLYKKALDLRKGIFGNEHPDIARNLNQLAFLYFRQQRFKEAERLYLRALAIGKKILGQTHPDIGRNLDNLAMLHASKGNRSKAENLYNQALEILTSSLGDNHPWTVRCRENITSLQQSPNHS